MNKDMSVQRFNKNQSDVQPYHQYYDMNIINNDSSFPAQPVRFQYKETRSNYFLLSPQDYFMSIVRFNLQTPTLPVLIPQINLNPNTNIGGVYPIQSMSGTFATVGTGVVNLYTPTAVPVGTVVLLGLSGGGTVSTYETSATYNQFYRVLTSKLSATSVGQTELGLYNPNATGTPNNYAGGVVPITSATSPPVANQINGGTITVGFAYFSIASMSYSSGTGNLTINFTAIPTVMPDLRSVFNVGDQIYVNNSSQYNGVYRIASFANSGLTIICPAPNLATFTPLNAYAGGGLFVSAGDFYNVTPYVITQQFTVSNTVYSGSSAVIYIPNDATQNPPQWNPANPQALSIADVTNDYYWVYNYEVFINMVNHAMENSFWLLNGSYYQKTGNHLPMSSTTNALAYQPPSMAWNAASLTAIITADNNAYAQSVGTYISLYFNQPMSTLFDSFPYQYPRVNADSIQYSYLIFNTTAGAGLYIVSSYGLTGTVAPQYTGIQVYQDHQTAGLMNPIQSIVFTSTILPVVMESVGTPLVLNGTSQSNINLGSTANIFPVLTDFTVPFTATNTYAPEVSYVPNGEYRLVDLYGESPANQIDIQVYWKDQYGLLHPFFLGSGCSGSLKIMFRRKDYNSVTLSE